MTDTARQRWFPARGGKRERGARPTGGEPRLPPQLYAASDAPGRHWETGKAGRYATTREPGDLPPATRRPSAGRGASAARICFRVGGAGRPARRRAYRSLPEPAAHAARPRDARLSRVIPSAHAGGGTTDATRQRRMSADETRNAGRRRAGHGEGGRCRG